MKQRPIPFSAPMVRALLDGSKTQTRRVGKIQSPDFVGLKAEAVTHATLGCQIQATHDAFPGRGTSRHAICACPYGKPGDQLWVRETWQGPLLEEYEVDADADWQSANRIHQYQNPAHCAFAADGGSPPEFIDSDDNIQRRWRPSIHMPRWASRITLEITGVRVERLQDISEEDAKAEGCKEWLIPGQHSYAPIYSYKQGYRVLWQTLNGPSSWDLNPWVWVVEFRRLS
jgi:hypothetical protein